MTFTHAVLRSSQAFLLSRMMITSLKQIQEEQIYGTLLLLLRITADDGEVNRAGNQIGLGSKHGSCGNPLYWVPPVSPHSTSSRDPHPFLQPLLWQSAPVSFAAVQTDSMLPGALDTHLSRVPVLALLWHRGGRASWEPAAHSETHSRESVKVIYSERTLSFHPRGGWFQDAFPKSSSEQPSFREDQTTDFPEVSNSVAQLMHPFLRFHSTPAPGTPFPGDGLGLWCCWKDNPGQWTGCVTPATYLTTQNVFSPTQNGINNHIFPHSFRNMEKHIACKASSPFLSPKWTLNKWQLFYLQFLCEVTGHLERKPYT